MNILYLFPQQSASGGTMACAIWKTGYECGESKVPKTDNVIKTNAILKF